MKVRLEDLTDGMEKFDRLITTQHNWLNQCQTRIQSLPSDSNGAVENENIIQDLTTLHSQVLATVKIGLLLINQHGENVLPTITKILDLTMHFDNVCSEAHSKHCNLDMAKLQLKLFKGSLDGMLAWLRKKTEAIEEQSGYISDDQEKIKELLDWHSKLRTDIERHRAVRDTILDISERFIKEGHTSDTASLKVSVDELKSGFSNLEDAFKKGKHALEEQNCSLQNIGELLGDLNGWIHTKHKFIQAQQKKKLPEKEAALAQMQLTLTQSWDVLKGREEHVDAALASAYSKIESLTNASEKTAITSMADMVSQNWEQLRRDFEKLKDAVDAKIAKDKIDETKINEMYTWAVEFYKNVTTSIEIHLSLALEEQLYILKSSMTQLEGRFTLLLELRIEAYMKVKIYARKYGKIEQIMEKVKFKIEDRRGEVEHTIEQLNEFELAVDKGLAWLTNQENILRHIVVIQDEDSLELLKEQQEEVLELLDHVESNMESISIVLKTGQEMGLEEMNRFSLFTKLTSLDTRWIQIDIDCRQKLIQIMLNILSIKEYCLLQWLVMIEEQLTVNIEIITKVQLEIILAEYRTKEIDYNEIMSMCVTLEVKVDRIELQELKRDIKIIETHWVNVYELLMSAFAMIQARDEAESEEDDSSTFEKDSDLFMEVWYGDDGQRGQGPRPQFQSPGFGMDLNMMNINVSGAHEGGRSPEAPVGGGEGGPTNIHVEGGKISNTLATPDAETQHRDSTSTMERDSVKTSTAPITSSYGGMAGYGVQMPQLGQMQYQHHCCATETVAETEVDSSRFLSAILDLRSWIGSHRHDLEQYSNSDIEMQLQWLTDLYQVLVHQEVTIRDTHATIKATLPKLTIGAKEQLSNEIEGMLEDFRNLKAVVEANLHQTKVLRNDYVDFEDTMAQFEEELLDMEDTLGVIRARVYNFDQIIVNITDLAELEGKLELWRSLFDKGLDGAGCPMIPALMSSIQMLGDQWASLFDKCRDLKLMLKNGHHNVTKIEAELKDLHEWIQIKESETGRAKVFGTLEELQFSCNVMTNISLEAQAKRAFFEPLRFTSIDQFHGTCITNLKEFYANLGTRVVALWQDTENMVLSLTRSANVVLELDTKCQNFKSWCQAMVGEVDRLAKPACLDESKRMHAKLEDYIDIVPQQERELEIIVSTAQGLDPGVSVLLTVVVTTASQDFNILKVLLKKKHSIVVELMTHFTEEMALLGQIEAQIKASENILNSPLLIPCNSDDLANLNGEYQNMEAELAKAAEAIAALDEHNPELAAQLRERCAQAEKQHHSNSARVGDAMSSLTSLNGQMDDMIYWEDHILTLLGDVEQPNGERAQVLAQEAKIKDIIKDIERKDMTYNRIVDKTNTSLIEFELGTGQVLEEKLEVIESKWREIHGLKDEHKKTIDTIIAHFKDFDAGSLNHQAFLQSQQAHFNYIAENVGSGEASKRSQKLQEETAKSTILEDMNTALSEVKKQFPNVKVNGELEQFKAVKADQTAFVEQVEEQVEQLKSADLAMMYSNIPIEEVLEWVNGTYENEVKSTEGDLPGSIEETEKELDKHEKILADIAQKQKDIIKIQAEAEKLFQEKGDTPGMKLLAEKIENLKQLWEDTREVSKQRQKLLEDRLVVLGTLSDDLEDHFTWINRTRASIEEGPAPGETEQELTVQIEYIKGVRAEIGDHGHMVTAVCNKGHELLQHATNTDTMGARLRDVTEYWQTLNDIARDRHLLLQSTLQIVQKDGSADTELLYTWSKDITDKLSPASLPPTFTTTELREMLEATRQLSDEIQLKLPIISAHLDKLRDKGPLKGKAKRLEQSINKTLSKIQDKERYLKEHSSILDQMYDLPQLNEWLSQSENIIDQSDNINPDNAEQIRHIVDTYSNVKSDVDDHAAHMDSLVDIPTECIPADYQELLNDIINKWTYVSGNIAAKQIDMSELEHALEQYDATMDNLIQSKEGVDQRLRDLCEESGSVDEISMKLQQHKLLTREITRVTNSDSSRNQDKVLQSFNKILGCDNVFSHSIEEYKVQWEGLVDRINDSRNHLTETRTEWIQFNDSCNNKLAWMTERFIEIEELEALCEEGTPDVLNSSLDRLKALYKSLEFHGGQVDQICVQAEGITSLEHPQLQKLRGMWGELKAKTELTKSSIEASYTNSSVTQSLQNLFQWLGEKEEMSVLRLPIPKDLELLHKDTENLKLLFNELERNADKVERLIEKDTDVEDVQLLNQVELLEQKWNRICDVAAGREEEMKEIRLQLEEYEQEFERVCSWLDEKGEKLSAMQLSVSNEMMLEQYLGELDEFLKLETIAQTELQGLKEGARRLHGDNIPNKVSNALSSNCRRWNALCQQAKSTKINLQQRLRSVLKQKSELDEIVKTLNTRLVEIQEMLSFVEQTVTRKEVFIEKERVIEKSVNTLSVIEEDYNLLHKLMLTCPVELHDHFSSHLNVIEETYTKVKTRHKMGVQKVSEKIILVNQYGKHLDDTTGTIVSVLSELQDRKPFSCSSENLMMNLADFKAALSKHKELSADVRSLQTDSLALPFFQEDITNLKLRLSELEQFVKANIEVLLAGNDMVTQFKSHLATAHSFINEIYKEVEESIKPRLESASTQVLYNVENDIKDVVQCIQGKNYLIDEMEKTLSTFDVNNFNMEALHVEYEDIIATWLGLQNDLESYRTKLSVSLASKTTYKTLMDEVRELLRIRQDSLRVLNDVDNEEKLNTAVEILNKLISQDSEVSEKVDTVTLEGKKIIRSIDNVDNMKSLQAEITSIQSLARNIQDEVMSKQKKYSQLQDQVAEFRSSSQQHSVFISDSLTEVHNLSTVLDKNVLESNKVTIECLEGNILDTKMQHDNLVRLGDTVLRTLSAEASLAQVTCDLKENWHCLIDTTNEATVNVESSAKRLNSIYTTLATLRSEALAKQANIVDKNSLSSDMATLRRQHREMRLGVKDIDNYVTTVERSKVNIQSLLECCSEEVRTDVAAQMTQFNELWGSIKRQSEDTFSEIDQHLGGVKRYSEILSEEHTWLTNKSKVFDSLVNADYSGSKDSLITLSQDINLHYSILTKVQESIRTLNVDPSLTHECAMLVQDCLQFKSRVDVKLSELDAHNSITYKVLNNVEQMIRTVYERKRNLDSHQPVSTNYDTILFQSTKLKEYRLALTTLEGQVQSLLQSAGSTDEVNLKLDQLREAWQELVEEVASREHQIVQMMELLGNFESNFTQLDTWIEDKKKVVSHSLPEYYEGLVGHLELIESIKSTLESKQHAVQNVKVIGDVIIAQSSAADVEHVQSKLHHITQEYERFNILLEDCIEDAKEAQQELELFDIQLGKIYQSLEKYQLEHTSLLERGLKADDVKRDLIQLLHTVQDDETLINNLTTHVKKIANEKWDGENVYCQSKLAEMRAAWDKVVVTFRGTIDHIEQSGALVEKFIDSIDNIIRWINVKMDFVNQPASNQDILAGLTAFREAYRDVKNKELNIHKAMENGAHLLVEDVDSSAVIEAKLEELNKLYKALTVRYEEHSVRVEAEYNNYSNLQNKIDSVQGKLSKFEELHLSTKVKGSCKVEEVIDEIEVLRKSAEESQIIQQQITEIESNSESSTTVTESVAGLKAKVESIKKDLASRIKALELHKTTLENINTEMVAINEWTDSSATNLLSSINGATADQLEVIKGLLSEVTQRKAQLTTVKRNMNKFIKERKPRNASELTKRMMAIEENFADIEESIIEREQVCEEEVQNVENFQESINTMCEDVYTIDQKLAANSKMTLNQEEAGLMLDEHNTIQQNVAAMQARVDNINTMGFDLFTKFEERYPELEQELATLNSMWENTCRGCVDRQRQLEESISALDDFWSHYNDLRDWLRETQAVLNRPQSPGTPISEHLAKAEELLHIVEEKGPALDKMKQLAAKVPSSVLAQIDEEEEPLKLELEEALELYHNQVALIKCRIEKLSNANQAVSQYSQSVEEFMTWLSEFEVKLEPNMMFESTDASDIKNLQGKHKVHIKALGDKQCHYEQVREQGTELLTTTDDVHQVNLLLEALADKWDQVQVVCEEKEMRLEDGFQHTHQFEKNFKELIAWIQEAETQIREHSDDNDIHSRVERQQVLVSGLKEHEALFNHVFVLGEGLISLCVPTAAAPISHQLTSLEEQWEALKMHCVEEQDSLKGTVDNLMDMRSKLEFYLQWVQDVAEHCDSLDVPIPQSAAAIRNLVDELYAFCQDLKQQAPYLNDLVEQCDGLLEEGELSPDLTNDIEELRTHWAGITQYLDERFTELRRAQITLAKQPAPKPAKEPKTDGEKVDLEVQNAVASCCCESKFKCEMIAAGKYKFGESAKKHLVRILRTNIVVRVGGGWETIDSFLNQHDPCRVSSKGNIESILASLPKPGEGLGLMSASLTKNRTVLGFKETVKIVKTVKTCEGVFEQVTKSETDTDFAHANGPGRMAPERSRVKSMSSKSVAVTKSGSSERNMFSPVINTSYKGRGRSVDSATPSKSSTLAKSPCTPAKSTPTRQSSLRAPAPVTRSSSFVKEGNKIPLRKSKSYTVESDKSKLLESGRGMRPKSGDKPALSDRFTTFTPEKGVKRSESDGNIQSKRKSGIPVAKGRTLSRSASGESSGKSPGGVSTFGTRATSSKLGKLKNLRSDL